MPTIFVATLLTALALSPTSSQEYGWDFEGAGGAGGPEGERSQGLILTHAGATGDAALVIEGDASLLADSRESGEEWNEYIHTDRAACPLRAETAYTVTLRYRALEPHGPEVFYLLLRSEALGKESGDRGRCWWNAWDGRVHTKNAVIRTGPADDYYLILGIRDAGAIVVDDLRIWAGPPPRPGRVKSRPFPYAAEFDRFASSRAKDGTAAWADVIQVVLDPNAWDGRKPEDVEYLARLSPDFCLYLNVANPVVAKLGFPRSGFAKEYQELYKGDVREGSTWEAEEEWYAGNGFALGLDGEAHMDQTWAAGGYYMCHSGPRWHSYFLEHFLDNAAGRYGIAQDNIGVPTLWKNGYAFCDCCATRFGQYLAEAYSAEELAAWGVGDVSGFSIREHILAHSLEGEAALASPLVREYIKWYHRAQVGYWAECAQRVRDWSADLLHPYLVNGNLIGAMGPNPYAVALTPWVDFAYMEHWWPAADFYKPPHFNSAGWGYKLARSATGYARPVFVENALVEDGNAPYLTTAELTFAEGLANGGYRVFNTNGNIPRYAGPRAVDIPGMRDLHFRYADFVRRYRGLFFARKSAARAAVVYSVPTNMFHRFPAIPAMHGIDDYVRFAAACRLLERMHVPYDVLVLPHPELMPGDAWAGRLREFDLIVAPGVAAVSADQWDTLTEGVREGTRILAFAPFATHDENYNEVARPVPEAPGLVVAGTSDLALGRALWDRRWDEDATAEAARRVDELLPAPRRLVGPDLPDGVVVNAWEDEAARAFAVHLVNYDWDPATDEVRVYEDLDLAFDVPERYTDWAPKWIAPELVSPRGVEMRRDGGRAVVTLPRLGVYGAVVWADWEYLEAKRSYAEAFNLGTRLEAMGASPPGDWRRELVRMWSAGDERRLSRVSAAWRNVVEEREGEALQPLRRSQP